MKKPMLVSVAFAVLMISCTPVKFYTNSELSKEAGLKYYTSKPYIQIERDVSNNVVKANVIYMPDLSNPMYLVVKDGLGSRKFEVKLTEGTINTLGITTDPKIAETIESFGALISKTASAVSDLSALKGIPSLPAASTITELYEVIITNEGTTMRKIEFD